MVSSVSIRYLSSIFENRVCLVSVILEHESVFNPKYLEMSVRRFHTLIYRKLTLQAKCKDGTLVCLSVAPSSLLMCKFVVIALLCDQ